MEFLTYLSHHFENHKGNISSNYLSKLANQEWSNLGVWNKMVMTPVWNNQSSRSESGIIKVAEGSIKSCDLNWS
jgi:hypothetical protein